MSVVNCEENIMEKVAIFDFNGTLLPYDFGPKFLGFHKEFFKEKLTVGKATFKIAMRIVKYKLFSSYTKEQFNEEAFDDLTHTLEAYDRKQIEAFFAFAGEKFSQILDEEVLDELAKLKKEGYYTVLLSGNYRDLLSCLIEHIGIDFAIGSELKYKTIGDREVLDFSEKMDVIKNEKKSFKIQEELKDVNFANCIAYADSYYDKPVLELVGKPICVNPDAQLLAIAQQKNYGILYTKLKDKKFS